MPKTFRELAEQFRSDAYSVMCQFDGSNPVQANILAKAEELETLIAEWDALAASEYAQAPHQLGKTASKWLRQSVLGSKSNKTKEISPCPADNSQQPSLAGSAATAKSSMFKDPVYEILQQRLRDTKPPNFCFACNGSGQIAKPISEWDDSEHEYNACPRIHTPVKKCVECNGTGRKSS